jgi:hypothetical protein
LEPAAPLPAWPLAPALAPLTPADPARPPTPLPPLPSLLDPTEGCWHASGSTGRTDRSNSDLISWDFKVGIRPRKR